MAAFDGLEAVAVVVHGLRAAAVVRVEEILVVVLVALPLVEGEEDSQGHAKEHKAERVVVDAKSLITEGGRVSASRQLRCNDLDERGSRGTGADKNASQQS